MSYTAQSPIRRTMQRSDVDLDKLTAWAVRNGAQHEDYLDEYFGVLLAGCLYTGIDFWVLAGQGHLETDNWTSSWWVNRGNPAGLGITGDPGQNSGSQIWETGEQSAFGHLAHMVAYVWGEDWDMHWHESWPDPVVVDKRFGTAVFAYGGTAKTLRDLNGTWAIDPENSYHVKVANRANILQGVAGKEINNVAITFGRVPHPVYQRRIIEDNTAWDDLGPRVIRAVCWHRMIGTLWGTDDYFRNKAKHRALTDYGIGVKAEEPSSAGTILMWNDPRGRRAPHANGTVEAPYGDGALFVNRYGVSAVNRDVTSIEISGRTWDVALDPKSRNAIVALTAYWADQYKVPWTKFPIVPNENRSFVIWHQEFTIGTGKVCPGNVVMSETAALIAAVKERLRSYQESEVEIPSEPAYATPQPVPAGTRIINDRLFVGVDKSYTIGRVTTPRLWADPSSPATGDDLQPGESVMVSHMVEDIGAESGLTLVLADGSRIPALALVTEE